MDYGCSCWFINFLFCIVNDYVLFSSSLQVISKLTDAKATHIPYRDSKLTRLLQSSLSGHGRVSVSRSVELYCFLWLLFLCYFFCQQLWLVLRGTFFSSHCMWSIFCSLFAMLPQLLPIVKRHTILWSLHIGASMWKFKLLKIRYHIEII